MENTEKKLEFNLHFIEQVKEGNFCDINPSETLISPRMDEPSIYCDENEENVLLSFCD
jgi:hypothetical protein